MKGPEQRGGNPPGFISVLGEGGIKDGEEEAVTFKAAGGSGKLRAVERVWAAVQGRCKGLVQAIWGEQRETTQQREGNAYPQFQDGFNVALGLSTK